MISPLSAVYTGADDSASRYSVLLILTMFVCVCFHVFCFAITASGAATRTGGAYGGGLHPNRGPYRGGAGA
jgi:hypothetical protein